MVNMKTVFSKMDKTLLFLLIAFFIFGAVMILSASSMESFMRYGYGPYHYFYRQAIFVGIGFILFFIIIHIPTKAYKRLSYLLIIISIFVLLALTVYGRVANNAQSWFKIGALSIQPSEFCKVITIIFLASYYDYNKENLNNIKKLILPIIPVFIIFVIVALQPDLGTALIIGLISFFMFFSLPMPRKNLRKFKLGVLVVVLLGIIIFLAFGNKILKDYQRERFNFKDPCERYQQKSGYQLCNSFIAFKNGGVTGQGIGKSTQKYLYLPESYTDFIFPIIVEEWGAWMGVLLILLYLIIIYRLYRIARQATTLYNSLLAYGVCIYLLLHVSVNLSGIMGLIPLTGVPLPFLSYGGSYALNLISALAIAERVAIESYNNKMKTKKKKLKNT